MAVIVTFWELPNKLITAGHATLNKYFFFYHSRTPANVFRLHDLRFIFMLLLIFANICHLCSNTLVAVKVSSIHPILYALLLLFCNLSIIVFIRLIEVKDQHDWLYLTLALEMAQFMFAVWKFHHLTQTLAVSHLQSFISLVQIVCLLFLIVVDGTAKYLEVSCWVKVACKVKIKRFFLLITANEAQDFGRFNGSSQSKWRI